jgi:uncharacterized protein
MRYNVAGLLMSPTGEDRMVEVQGHVDLGEGELALAGSVSGTARLMREPDGVLVVGALVAPLSLQCARCLAAVEQEVAFEIVETFRPTVELPGGPPPCRDREDEATLIDDLHVLDLTEVVRQAVLLAVPTRPLCRPDCRGLCARCGADLNQAACACEPEPDPRWDALRSILEEG